MATTTIPWGDGSGDNIYLTYSSASGDQTVEVSSDANTGGARTQTVTFTSGVGSITQQLTVSQEAGVTQHTLTKYPSGYDTSHYAYRSISDISNAYTSSSSGTIAKIYWVRGSGAQTYMYFTFDLSSIPTNATIDSITLTAKAQLQMANRLSSSGFYVCRGTEAVGTKSSNFSTSVGTYNVDTGTGWTGANIQDLTLKISLVRNSTGTNSDYFCNFYGATLTIKYTA